MAERRHSLWEPDLTRIRVGRSFRVNWAAISEDPACYLYEVYDRHGRVIYVGITESFAARWSSHLQTSWWAKSVDISCVLLNGYRTRRDARLVEASAIAEHRPPCNTKPERKYLSLALAEGLPDEVLTAELHPTRKF